MKSRWPWWAGGILAVLLILVTLFNSRGSGPWESSSSSRTEPEDWHERSSSISQSGRARTLARAQASNPSPLSRSRRTASAFNRKSSGRGIPLNSVSGSRRKGGGIPLGELFGSREKAEAPSLTPDAEGRIEEAARIASNASSQRLPAAAQARSANPAAADELLELEREYQNAQTRLFGGGGGSVGGFGSIGNGNDNPFDDALDDVDGGDDSGNGDPATDDGGTESPGTGGDDGTGGGDDGGGGSGTGENGETGGEGGDDGGQGSGGPVAPPFFDFILTGPIGGADSEEQFFRAWRSTSTVFRLENAGDVLFQPGFTPFNLFDDQQVYLGDADGDGDLDVTLVSLIPTVGSTVETFINSGNGFELAASVLTYLKSVRCIEYFDFNRDEINELVLTFEDEPNLHIYENQSGTWTYRNEVALSFIPGILIRSEEGSGAAESILYIMNRSFDAVVNVLSLRPDLVRGNPSIPLTRKTPMRVRWRPSTPTATDNVLAIRMSDKLILVDSIGNSWHWIATIEGRELERTIIGYFNGTPTRQILWIP